MKKNSFAITDYLVHGLFFLLYGFVKYLPSPIGDILRFIIVRPFLASCGGVRIYEGVTLWYPYRMRIGKGVTLNEWVYISAYGGVVIGNNVRIGHRVTILSSDHEIRNRNVLIKDSGLKKKSVEIGDDVFIGANATVLNGVKIGNGAVVGAGSVVTKSIPEYTIVVGSPARPVGMR